MKFFIFFFIVYRFFHSLFIKAQTRAKDFSSVRVWGLVAVKFYICRSFSIPLTNNSQNVIKNKPTVMSNNQYNSIVCIIGFALKYSQVAIWPAARNVPPPSTALNKSRSSSEASLHLRRILAPIIISTPKSTKPVLNSANILTTSLLLILLMFAMLYIIHIIPYFVNICKFEPSSSLFNLTFIILKFNLLEFLQII